MKKKKNKVKAGFLLRLKFAWKAFIMKDFEYIFPYKYYCNLRHDAPECDNNRRISKCNNQAKVALMNPFMKISLEPSAHTYHVCNECAKKYIGTHWGEDYETKNEL